MTPIILRRETAHAGYIKVERLRLRLAGGAEVEREVESHGNAAAVLPYDPDRRCALTVDLFRAPVLLSDGRSSLEEACAGMIDDGEAAADAARREAAEELGVTLGAVEFVARVWPSPGVCAETAALFLATYSPGDRFGPGGGLAAEHEDITVIERPLAELARMSDAGEILDGKLLTLVFALRLRRPDLFGAP